MEYICSQEVLEECFPGGSVVKNSPANARDVGSAPVWEDPMCHAASESSTTSIEPVL